MAKTDSTSPTTPPSPPPNSPEEARPDTRERLLKAAATLFARKSFDGTSVKEIAEAAGANVSLVSYYFQGKEGLYRACLEQFGNERLAATQRCLQRPQTLEEMQIRLSMFFEELLIAHIEQPEITQLIHRESDQCSGRCEDIFQNTFLKSFEALVQFFASAQDSGILEARLSPQILGGLAFGAILNTGRADELNKRYFHDSITEPKYRKNVIDCVVRAFTTSFTPKEGAR